MAREGGMNALKRMLQAGSGSLNSTDPATGMTAIMLAAPHGHDDAVLGLCKGASTGDIHRVHASGDSALSVAAAHGHADVLELLLNKAAGQGQEAAVAALPKAGAGIHHADAHGDTALILAARAGKLDVAQALLQAHPKLDRRTRSGWTALPFTSSCGHTAIAEALIMAGADKRYAYGKSKEKPNMEVDRRFNPIPLKKRR